MAGKPPAVNPFYVVLVLVGIAFTVSASAYGVWTLQGSRGPLPDYSRGSSQAAGQTHPLWDLMDRHGLTILMTEIILLAVATAGAMATDQHWQRRTDQQAAESEPPPG